MRPYRLRAHPRSRNASSGTSLSAEATIVSCYGLELLPITFIYYLSSKWSHRKKAIRLSRVASYQTQILSRSKTTVLPVLRDERDKGSTSILFTYSQQCTRENGVLSSVRMRSRTWQKQVFATLVYLPSRDGPRSTSCELCVGDESCELPLCTCTE